MLTEVNLQKQSYFFLFGFFEVSCEKQWKPIKSNWSAGYFKIWILVKFQYNLG